MAKLTYLAFQGRLNRTICAFTSEQAVDEFIRAIPVNDYDRLPTVHPAARPIPTFDSAQEALEHFKVVKPPVDQFEQGQAERYGTFKTVTGVDVAASPGNIAADWKMRGL